MPTHSDGDVISTQLPAKLLAEEIRDGTAKAGAAGRRLIVAEHVLQFAWCGCDLFDPLAPECIHFDDVGGLAAAEHVHFVATGGERMP